MTWAADRTLNLVNLWCAGISIGEIATELRVSKECAYSKILRMGLSPRGKGDENQLRNINRKARKIRNSLLKAVEERNRCRTQVLQAAEDKSQKGKQIVQEEGKTCSSHPQRISGKLILPMIVTSAAAKD